MFRFAALAILIVPVSARAACPADDPAALPYQPARPSSDPCSAADLRFIELEAEKTGATLRALQTALDARNATCSRCVFSQDGDPAWGPFVFVGDAGWGFVNFGGCYERASASLDCGQTLQKFELCADARCRVDEDSCADEAAAAACIESVARESESCGQFDYLAACPNLAELDQRCGHYLDVIRVLCSAAPSDAGVITAPVTPAPPEIEASTDSAAAAPTAPRREAPRRSRASTSNHGCAQTSTSPLPVLPIILAIVASSFRRRLGWSRSPK